MSNAYLDEVLDEDAPRDSPLLQRHDSAANVLGRNLRLVHRYYSRADSNGIAAHDTTNAEERNAVGRSLQDSADNPDECSDLDSSAAREAVGQEGRAQSTDERASRHCRGDAALTGARRFAEVPCVRGSTKNTGHGRDVKAEERAAYRGEAADGWNVVRLCMVLGSSRTYRRRYRKSSSCHEVVIQSCG